MPQQFIERTNCPTCHSSNLQELACVSYTHAPLYNALKSHYEKRGDFNGELLKDADYNLQECVDCSLVFQKWIPNDELLKTIYTVWIDTSKSQFSNPNINRHSIGLYQQEINYLVRLFKTNNFKSFDFGMGRAHWAGLARAAGIDSYGYEIDPGLMEAARKVGIKTVEYEAFPEYRNYFDYIHTEQVFEHLSDPEKELRYLSPMLKVGGVIKLSVPPGLQAKSRIKEAVVTDKWDINGRLKVCTPLQHLNAYPHKALVVFAEKNGFKYLRPKFMDMVKTRELVYPDSLLKTYIRPFYVHFLFNYGSSLYFQKIN